MKFRFLFVGLLVLFLLPIGLGAQHSEAITKGARAYTNALSKSKWEKVIALTFPDIVEKNGGKEGMLRQASTFEQTMLQSGLVLKKAELSEPLEEYVSGEYLMCLVPMRLTFEGALGKVYSESSLLAVSGDEGKSWTYIDMSQITITKLSEIFPNLNPSMEIPAKRITQEAP